jgi:isopenicillin-N epimerase
LRSLTIKHNYLLDPHITFLNHGSFGACPVPVFETYQRWQREMERQPVEFIGRRSPALLAEARARLGAYLNAPPNDLVYYTNSTMIFNMVARSLNLQPGDEILSTDNEYPAMKKVWDYVTGVTGAVFVQRPIPLPLTTAEAFVEHFWAGVTQKTRVIFLSHIPFSLAAILPVKEICRRAKAAGLVCIIDGAHGTSQLTLDLQDIGADIYFGACHKWLSAPKGSSYLYASPEAQTWLNPLVISHGWSRQACEAGQPSHFVDFNEYQGTRDLSAFLSVPAAIDFQAEHDWPAVRKRCHQLASQVRQRIETLTGLPPLYPDSPEWYGQMVSVRLPAVDPVEFKTVLYDRHRVEVPLIQLDDGSMLMRVSFQAYNDEADIYALLAALEKELPVSFSI